MTIFPYLMITFNMFSRIQDDSSDPSTEQLIIFVNTILTSFFVNIGFSLGSGVYL